MSNELTVQSPSRASMEVSCFSNIKAFEDAQRMAKVFSESTLVPKDFQRNIGNCVIAMDMSNRMGANPLMVMQNLYIVHGKPSWSSTFIISAINTCGRFKPLRFDITGQENADDRSCVAWTVEMGVVIPVDIRTLAQAEAKNLPVIKGPKVSIKMAKAEGWYDKNGSKWKTMPDVMLNYRAASFFGKLYAPEILMGMQTREELEDMVDVTPKNNTALKDAFMAAVDSTNIDTETGEVTEPQNKMDEILSRPAPKAPNPPKVSDEVYEQQELLADAAVAGVAEALNNLHEQKVTEISNLIFTAPTSKSVDDIIKNNQDSITMMNDEYKKMITVAVESRKHALKK